MSGRTLRGAKSTVQKVQGTCVPHIKSSLSHCSIRSRSISLVLSCLPILQNHLACFLAMLSRSVRRFTTTACRAAELASHVDAANRYRVQLAKVQGHVEGFVGGMKLSIQ